VTGFDFVVLAILAVSGVLGLVRGLLKEVLSLVAYLLAFGAAIWWGPTVYAWVEPYI
jgi:membrane protein required for colicin V production